MIKNFIKYVGVIIIILFSFFLTEKTATTIKESSPLRKEIIEVKDQYKIDAIEGIIDGDTIIPGIPGCEVNIEESYNKIKKYGEFNNNLLIFSNILPINSLDNNFNKYIIKANKNKDAVSLIFKVKNNSNIDSILDILNNYNVKASFFIDGTFIEKNIEKMEEIIKSGHEILNYGYNGLYDKDLIVWNNNLIERIKYDNPKICYLENKNNEVLKMCNENKMNTIIPNIITNKKPFEQIKNNLEKGSLISFNINDIVKEELNLIIKYIKQKGYNILLLSEHINDKYINNCKK